MVTQWAQNIFSCP